MGVGEKLVPARLGAGFRWLLASSWISNLGDGITLAAGPLLMASMTDDAFLVALATLMRWAPPMIFGLYAGVLSDRLDRRRLVIVANLVRAVALVAMVVMMVTGLLTAAWVLIILGLITVAEVFADNTSATLGPMLVPRDDLTLANSRLQTGFITLNQLAGPPVGAALFAAGAVWPFVADLVLLLAGILMLARITLPAHGVEETGGRRSLRRDISEGFWWTVRHPAVRTLVLTILLFNVTFGAAWAVLVLYAQDHLGMGAIGFGLLTTISAIGGLLGTMLYVAITRRVSLGNVMRIGLIIETVTYLGLALTTSPVVASVILFVFGAHAFIWGTTSVTVRQRAVPTHLQGRVTSLNTICVYGGLVFGSVIGGVLATRYGVTAPFWFAFVGSAVFVVLLWREMSRIAHADDAVPAEAVASRID